MFGTSLKRLPPPKNDARRRRSRLVFEELEARDVPSTLIYEDVFDFSEAATVTVTVTEDAPGYEGKYLWNYHVHNDAFQHGPENWLGMFAVDLDSQDFQNELGVANIGNNMGWGTVETLDPAELAWQAGEFNPQIEIGQSGDFWFTTPPTAVLMSDGYVSDTGFAFQADGPVVAPAPALVVTTNLDVVDLNDGLFSLREAINTVNSPQNLAGFWRVKFAAHLDGATITLDPNTAGGAQLSLQKNAFIDGPANKITVQRDPNTQVKHRIFDVAATSETTLARLELLNGDVTGSGGAVWSRGGLSVQDCEIRENHATAGGGGIAASGFSLSVSDTAINGNAASIGGGVYISANVNASISSSVVGLNSATTSGGGIYIAPSTNANPTVVTLYGVEVVGNQAQNFGGGINAGTTAQGAGTSLTLASGTNIHNNQVLAPAPNANQGGGVYFGAGTITLAGVTIANNSATTGSQMYRVNGTALVLVPGTVNTYQEVLGP